MSCTKTIIVEGVDFVGKTVVCKAFAKTYGFEYRHFPSSGPLGTIAQHWHSKVGVEPSKLIYLMDMVEQTITDKNLNLVCDRSYLSTIIYDENDPNVTSLLDTFHLFTGVLEQLLNSKITCIVLEASEHLLKQRLASRKHKQDHFDKWPSIILHRERYRSFARILQLPVVQTGGKEINAIVQEVAAIAGII